MSHYKIKRVGQSEYTEQDLVSDLSSGVRVSKVVDTLTSLRPTEIPFKIKFPIVSHLDYKTFSELIMISNTYEGLPKFVKDKVELAEKVKFFDLKFKKYLEDKNMDEGTFRSKNPVTKLDILYDWMFLNKIDIGILG